MMNIILPSKLNLSIENFKHKLSDNDIKIKNLLEKFNNICNYSINVFYYLFYFIYNNNDSLLNDIDRSIMLFKNKIYNNSIYLDNGFIFSNYFSKINYLNKRIYIFLIEIYINLNPDYQLETNYNNKIGKSSKLYKFLNTKEEKYLHFYSVNFMNKEIILKLIQFLNLYIPFTIEDLKDFYQYFSKCYKIFGKLNEKILKDFIKIIYILYNHHIDISKEINFEYYFNINNSNKKYLNNFYFLFIGNQKFVVNIANIINLIKKENNILNKNKKEITNFSITFLFKTLGDKDNKLKYFNFNNNIFFNNSPEFSIKIFETSLNLNDKKLNLNKRIINDGFNIMSINFEEKNKKLTIYLNNEKFNSNFKDLFLNKLNIEFFENFFGFIYFIILDYNNVDNKDNYLNIHYDLYNIFYDKNNESKNINNTLYNILENDNFSKKNKIIFFPNEKFINLNNNLQKNINNIPILDMNKKYQIDFNSNINVFNYKFYFNDNICNFGGFKPFIPLIKMLLDNNHIELFKDILNIILNIRDKNENNKQLFEKENITNIIIYIITHSQYNLNLFNLNLNFNKILSIKLLKSLEIFNFLSYIFKEKNLEKLYKKLIKELFTNNGFWSFNNEFDIDNIYGLGFYKIKNILTEDYKLPFLNPILDLNYYKPNFKSFKDFDTKFIQKNKLILNNEIQNLKLNLNDNLKAYMSFYSNEFLENYYKNKYRTNDIKLYKCCLIKKTHHIRGFIFYNNYKLYFISYYNNNNCEMCNLIKNCERNFCYGSVFNCPKKDELKYIEINLNEIKFIIKKNYFYRNSALEFYIYNGKDYLFNFNQLGERNELMKQILIFCDEIYSNSKNLKVFGYKISLDKLQNIEKFNSFDILNKESYISNYLNEWHDRKLSNFELIMIMNVFSNRSLSDIFQYPIFPLVIYENDKKERKIRDLTKPIGEQIYNDLSLTRIELINNSFISLLYEIGNEEYYDKHSLIPKINFYQTNYSNPVYLSFYMLRTIPFSFTAIELQGKFFDTPNRLFLSYNSSVKNSLTQKSDVRELIPELYYFPENLINLNHINFNPQNINEKFDTDLGDFQNNFKFISFLRLNLEKQDENILNWLNLIFGKNQKPNEKYYEYIRQDPINFLKNKQNLKNLFRTESYIEKCDPSLVNNEIALASYEFGVIPTQLFREDIEKEFKNREIKNLNLSSIKFNENVYELDKNFKNFNIYKIEIINDSFLIILYYSTNQIGYEKFDIYKFQTIEIRKFLNKNNEMEYYKNLKLLNLNLKILVYDKNLNYLFLGGYNKINYFFVVKNNVIKEKNININNTDNIIITSLEIIEKNYENNYIFLISGDNKGNISIIKFYKQELIYEIIKILYNIHYSCVINIIFNKTLNSFLSYSNDGYIFIYSFYQFEIIKYIKLEDNNININYINFSVDPLPSIIIVNNNSFISYSLNGSKIYNENNKNKTIEENIFKEFLIIKDNYNLDNLLILTKNNEIIFYELPYFNNKLNNRINIPIDIHNFLFTSDKKYFLYFINKDNKFCICHL